jgi:hypothetical protein
MPYHVPSPKKIANRSIVPGNPVLWFSVGSNSNHICILPGHINHSAKQSVYSDDFYGVLLITVHTLSRCKHIEMLLHNRRLKKNA